MVGRIKLLLWIEGKWILASVLKESKSNMELELSRDKGIKDLSSEDWLEELMKGVNLHVGTVNKIEDKKVLSERLILEKRKEVYEENIKEEILNVNDRVILMGIGLKGHIELIKKEYLGDIVLIEAKGVFKVKVKLDMEKETWERRL